MAGIVFAALPQFLATLSTRTENAIPQIIGGVLGLVLIVLLPEGISGVVRWARWRVSTIREGVKTLRGVRFPSPGGPSNAAVPELDLDDDLASSAALGREWDLDVGLTRSAPR
jgi:hypothetical protein